jgi:hypothetical protein
MDAATISAVVLAILGGVAGEAGGKLWDGLIALVRRPGRDRPSKAGALPSGMAELAALEQAPANGKLATALSEALLVRADADSDFRRELESWWTQASQVHSDLGNVTNTISGGTQHGPVLQGRDFSNISFGAETKTSPLSSTED